MCPHLLHRAEALPQPDVDAQCGPQRVLLRQVAMLEAAAHGIPKRPCNQVAVEIRIQRCGLRGATQSPCSCALVFCVAAWRRLSFSSHARMQKRCKHTTVEQQPLQQATSPGPCAGPPMATSNSALSGLHARGEYVG